jgi:hypothetical protein
MSFTGNLDHFVLFERIARERADIRTLHTRGRDSLDFHDVPVWALLDMMQSGYDAGFKVGVEHAIAAYTSAKPTERN